MNRTMNEYEVFLCHKFKWFIGGADQASNMLHRQFLAPILYTHPTSLAAVGYTYSWMIVTQGDYENMVVVLDDPAVFPGHYLQAWSIRAKTAWIEWFGQIRAVISKQGRSCWAPPGDFYSSITKKAGPEDLCMIVQSQ